MSLYSENIVLAYIEEIGEEDIVLSIKGEREIVVLTNQMREDVMQAVENDSYIVLFNQETKEFVTEVGEETLESIFPESSLDTLKGVTDELPEDLD